MSSPLPSPKAFPKSPNKAIMLPLLYLHHYTVSPSQVQWRL
jgi:hypothetical protein